MKMQAPEGCSGATVNGEPVVLDNKGQCEVQNAEAVEALKIHGFTEVKGKPKLQPKEEK